MNKYKKINKETKRIGKEILKDSLLITKCKLKGDMYSLTKVGAKVLANCALIACYAINICEDVEQLDVEMLEAYLTKENIDCDDFLRRVTKYKCSSYAMVNEYFWYSYQMSHDIKMKSSDLFFDPIESDYEENKMYEQIKTSLNKKQEIINTFNTEGLTTSDYEMLMDEYVPDDKRQQIKELSDYMYNHNIAPFVKPSKRDIKDLITITNKIK